MILLLQYLHRLNAEVRCFKPVLELVRKQHTVVQRVNVQTVAVFHSEMKSLDCFQLIAVYLFFSVFTFFNNNRV